MTDSNDFVDRAGKNLRSDEVRQGTLPNEEIRQLLSAVEAGEPWTDVLRRLELPWLSRKRDWFVNAEKARFFLQLSAPAQDLAIDIGPGSGVIATELARRFSRVVALEHHPLWCAFMRARFRQDGTRGVTVVRGDGLNLPVSNRCADLVVLNGVLEWIPEAAPGVSPRTAQLSCLREAARALKPGGTLGIAIENRLFLGNFIGGSPHGEPPFAVMMPRPAADWLTRIQRGRPYRTWIYGARGYARLLERAGFRDAQIRAVFPSYHEPRASLPLQPAAALRPFFQTTRRSKAVVVALLARLGLLGYVAHSFYISAHT